MGSLGKDRNRHRGAAASGKLHAQHLALFQFLGRVAGKALFEGIVANIPLADFFLNFLLQKPNSVDDLVSQVRAPVL